MAVNFTKADGGQMALIRSYGQGGFRVAGLRYEGAVLIVNGNVISLPITRIEDLTPEHLIPVTESEPKIDFLLVGSGTELKFPSQSVRSYLDGNSVGYDPMDTGAAARTYNVLLLEDRRVAAVLIGVE